MPVHVTALTDPHATATSHRLVWLASDDDGMPLGTAFLRLFTRTGQEQLADLQLHVHAQEQCEETGMLLLEPALSAARKHGRRRVISHVRADSRSERLLTARDFRRVLALTSARLPLPVADPAALTRFTEEPHPGYRLASWDGMVPDHLAETFVASRHAMNDTPTGGVDFSAVPWNHGRVRAAVDAVAKRGDVLHTVVAVHVADETIAGFTELAVPGDGKGDARHYGTAVLPSHRGRGLSLWMKAASIRHAGLRYPRLGGLLTDTADSNPYIRRVNDLLGYRATHTTYEYQLDLVSGT
ncbi:MULTISPECIES: GNAT family N-acetyltransferase [unclassified Streptomyces]|uniref:GNAT family N-acetyltransferase n=1 Tax=unclassified Streptomyces TaxID=2593676 RepID=UPI003828DE54